MEIFIGVSAMLGEPRDLLRQHGRIIDIVCPAGTPVPRDVPQAEDSDLLGACGSF